MAEKAFALGEVDPFPFLLARDLGKDLAEIDAMSHADYVRWLAFYRYERWLQLPPSQKVRRG